MTLTPSILTSRRQRLHAILENGDIALIFGADAPVGISRFLQNNNFLYLTGLYETTEAVYVCYKTADTITETLYIERNIPEMIVWDGAKLYPEEAQEISGIPKVKFLDELEADLPYSLTIAKRMFANYGVTTLSRPLNKILHFISKLRERYLHLSFFEANQLMSDLRKIKDEVEIHYLTQAIEITGIGLHEIFKNAKVGMYEYELEAMLFYELNRRGLKQFGFAPIIATGINAATLHYKKNNTQIKEDELVLCDVGALYHNYSADITRTFPIEKEFSTFAGDVYTEVLSCQKEIIAMIRPGVAMADLNSHTAKLIGESCIKLGLTTDPADYKKYYMHSVGHHLGMDTHDIAPRNSILEAGMVITIEPGIYIPHRCLGVRIEDDILVTDDGYKNLSAMIPKEIAEIEALRR
jgi:Xaa-Pro aminopeptidase